MFIKASAEEIWDAITKPEWTARYFHGARSLSRRSTTTPGPEGDVWGDWRCEVFDPPRKLVHGGGRCTTPSSPARKRAASPGRSSRRKRRQSPHRHARQARGRADHGGPGFGRGLDGRDQRAQDAARDRRAPVRVSLDGCRAVRAVHDRPPDDAGEPAEGVRGGTRATAGRSISPTSLTCTTRVTCSPLGRSRIPTASFVAGRSSTSTRCVLASSRKSTRRCRRACSTCARSHGRFRPARCSSRNTSAALDGGRLGLNSVSVSYRAGRTPCSRPTRRSTELDTLFARTFANANKHLTGIVKPERRLNARQVVRYLQGTSTSRSQR